MRWVTPLQRQQLAELHPHTVELLEQQPLKEVVFHPYQLIAELLVPVENGAHNLIQSGFLDERIHHVNHHFPRSQPTVTNAL